MLELDFDNSEQDPQPSSTIAEAVAREAQAKQRQQELTLDTAFQSNAGTAARAYTLSRRTGVPADEIEQDPTPAEKIAKQQAMSLLAARERNPVLARMTENLWFAKIAQDDIETLAATESTFDWAKRHVTAGWDDNERGYLALKQAFNGGAVDSEEEARMLEIDRTLALTENGFIGGGLRAAGQMSETLPPSLAVGAAAAAVATPVGGAIAGGATSFLITSGIAAGNAYRNMRLRGIPHEDAFAASMASGLGEGALETISTVVGARVFGKAAGKMFGKASNAVTDMTTGRARMELVKNYLKVVGTEGATESAQGGWQWGMEQAALKSAGFTGDDWSTLSERMADDFAQAIQSVALLSGIGPAANYIADMRQVGKVERRAQFFDRLGEQAKATTFAEAAPGVHEEFLANTAKEAGAETAHVRGERMAEVLLQADSAAASAGEPSVSKSLEEKIPGITEQITTAALDGGDVSFPLAKVVRTPLYDALKEHMRLDPSESSYADVQEAKEKAPELIKSLEKQIDDRIAFDESGDQVEARVLQEVAVAAPHLTKTQQQVFAGIARRMVEKVAIEQGKLPGDLPQISFTGKPVPAGSLNQFAGAAAQGVDLDALANAKARLAAGEAPEAVRQATGWFQGVDLLWRYEIDDSTSVLRTTAKGTYRLGDILDHPRLFAAYPDLADVRVDLTDKLDKSTLGTATARTAFSDARLEISTAKDAGTIKSTLHHEIQHLIQDVEDFATGGNQRRPDYWNLAGEREARDVQAREKLTDAQRRKKPPDTKKDQTVIVPGLGDYNPSVFRASEVTEIAKAQELREFRKAQRQAATAAAEAEVRKIAAEIAEAEANAAPLKAAFIDIPFDQAPGQSLEDWLAVLEKREEASKAYYAAAHAIIELKSKLAAAKLRAGDYTPTLFQPARGAFDPNTNTIHLNESTNPSTLYHEMAHAVWNMMLAVPERSPGMQKDIDAMFAWLGITEAEWNAMSEKDRVKHHEAIARAAEVYFLEGKAPTVELQGVFDRISKWIRDVYRQIVGGINAEYKAQFGVDLPALTPEVRRVFDNMLVAEDAMASAEVTRGRMAAFETRDSFPGDDAEWVEYQALVEARRAGGIAKLNAEMQKNIAWLGRSKDRVTKEVSAEAKKLRKAAKEEAETEVPQRPVYQLRDWLRTKASEGEQLHDIRIDDVKDLFGPEAQDVLTELKDFVREDGWSAEGLAEHFSFDQGAESMIRELLDAPTVAEAIEARTDEIMLRDHGSLRNAQEQAMAIEEALNNEATAKLAYATLRFAQQVKQPDRVTKAAVQEVARRKLEATPVRSVRAASYSRAAARAERAAAEAFKGKRTSKGKDGTERAAVAPDPEEGVRLLQQSLLNTEMARQALKIEREVAKTTERLTQFFRGDEKLRKTHKLDWVNVGRAILAGFSLDGKRVQLPLEYMASLAEYDPLLHAQLQPLVTLATGGNTLQDYRDLSVTEFRDLADSLNALWERSKREMLLEVQGKMVSKASAKAEVIAQLQKIATAPTTPLPTLPSDKRSNDFQSALAKISKTEHMLRWMDGGKANGPMQRYFWTTLRKALDVYHRERFTVVNKMNEVIQGLHDDGLLSPVKFDASETLGPGVQFNSTAHLLGLLNHMGNASNLDNLLKGYKWTRSQWDAFLEDLKAKNRITKKHLDALQKLGNLNAELFEQAQKVNKEVYDTYLKRVEIKKISTPWGDYAGWYAPSQPDLAHSKNRGLAEAPPQENPLQSVAVGLTNGSPTVPAGWRNARLENTDRPRDLDITKIAGHFDSMLRFIHLQVPLRDVWSMTKDPEIGDLLERASPGFVKNVLKPMLDDTAMGKMSKPGFGGVLSDKIISFLTKNTSRMFMAGSIKNMLQQTTGILNAVGYTSFTDVAAALRQHWALGAGRAGDFIETKSLSMRVRTQEHQGSLLQDQQLLLDPTRWGKVDRGVEKATYALIQFTQGYADRVTWIAAYNKELRANPSDEQAAITAADSVVRLAQGSRTTMDVASIERSAPEIRMLTQFGHYWFNVFNSIRFASEGERARARALAWSFMLPTLAGGAIAAALSGGKEWEDKEGEFDAGLALWWTLATPLKGGGSMFPVIGPVAASLATVNERPGSSISPFPAWSGIEATGRSVRELTRMMAYAVGIDSVVDTVGRSRSGLTSGQDIRDFGTTIAYWTGIPVTVVTKAFGYLEDRADDRTERNWFSGITGSGR